MVSYARAGRGAPGQCARGKFDARHNDTGLKVLLDRSHDVVTDSAIPVGVCANMPAAKGCVERAPVDGPEMPSES